MICSYLRDAEVTEDNPSAAEDEDVLRLNVSVKDAVHVHVVQPQGRLHEPGHHLALWE